MDEVRQLGWFLNNKFIHQTPGTAGMVFLWSNFKEGGILFEPY